MLLYLQVRPDLTVVFIHSDTAEEELRSLRQSAAELDRAGDISGAEALLQKALDVDPTDLLTLQIFASFLHRRRGELQRAEAFFNRALQMTMPSIMSPKQEKAHEDKLSPREDPPQNGDHAKLKHVVKLLLTFSSFMIKARADIEAAHKLLEKALELAPEDGKVLATVAHFLSQFSHDLNIDAKESSARIDELFRRSLVRQPGDTTHTLWYAKFLKHQGRLGPAELMYKSAVHSSLKTAQEPTALCNYATFLCKQRRKNNEARKMFEEALQRFPAHKGLLRNYKECLKRSETTS